MEPEQNNGALTRNEYRGGSPLPPDNQLNNLSPERGSNPMNQTLNQSHQPLNQTMTPQPKSLLVSPKRDQQNQNIPPGQVLGLQINRYILAISALTIIIIWWNIIFIEAFCLLRFACIPDGVETPMFVVKSMPVIFFFTLFFAPIINYVSKRGDKYGVKFFKFVNLALILAMIVLFIVALSLMGGFGEDDIITKWSELSSLDKSKFNDSISELVDKNKTNLLLHAIYNIVLAVLFVILTIVLYNFDYALPERWIQEAKSRVSFAADSLIVFSKKNAELELAEKRRKAILLTKMRRTIDLPQINEERSGLLRDKQMPEVGLMRPYDQDPNRSRNFADPYNMPGRNMEDQRLSTFGASPDRNYPYSPDQIPRRDYPYNPDQIPRRDYPYSPDQIPRRDYAQSPDQIPRRDYPQSPDQIPRRDYDDGMRSRSPNLINSNPRMQEIEMTTSNYGAPDQSMRRRNLG